MQNGERLTQLFLRGLKRDSGYVAIWMWAIGEVIALVVSVASSSIGQTFFAFFFLYSLIAFVFITLVGLRD